MTPVEEFLNLWQDISLAARKLGLPMWTLLFLLREVKAFHRIYDKSCKIFKLFNKDNAFTDEVLQKGICWEIREMRN